MAAVMSDVDVHGEQDFAPGEAAVWRIVGLVELLVGQAGYNGGAILEGTAEEFDDGIFVLVARGRRVQARRDKENEVK